MRLQLAILVALVPILVSSSPVSSRAGNIVNINKRRSFKKDGIVDIEALKAHIGFVRG